MTNTLSFADISTATLDRLTDELAAAGWDSTQRSIHEARDAVARLYHETHGCDLLDSQNDFIRAATADEAAESVCAGPEGWIMVDGQRCYVAG